MLTTRDVFMSTPYYDDGAQYDLDAVDSSLRSPRERVVEHGSCRVPDRPAARNAGTSRMARSLRGPGGTDFGACDRRPRLRHAGTHRARHHSLRSRIWIPANRLDHSQRSLSL